MRQMRAARQFVYFFALMIAFTLTGCGLSTASQVKASPVSTHVANQRRSLAPTPQTKAQANPVRLLIPSIGLNAPVETVGVAPNGDLAVPTANPWEDAGWYGLGPRPGERGSAVIDGHLDRPGGYPAVFWRLRYLHAGDAVIVIDVNGKTHRFHVTETAYYSPQAAPIQEIFGNQSGTYLNLITCAGDWIPNQHQTTLRLVVYTAPG